MQRLHEPRDMQKLERLTKSIRENGWQGPPLVVDGDLLLTGVHREEAWWRAGEWDDPPTIDISDIVPDYDERLAELMESLPWYDALMRIADSLSLQTRRYYGIDLH